MLGFMPNVYRIVEPYLAGLYCLPKIALAPLFVMLLGIDLASKVALVAITVFFLILYSTLDGVRDIDRDLVLSMRQMGATRRETSLKVLIPGALRWVFTGMRIAVRYAFTAAVLGEVIAANRGVGYLVEANAGPVQFDRRVRRGVRPRRVQPDPLRSADPLGIRDHQRPQRRLNSLAPTISEETASMPHTATPVASPSPAPVTWAPSHRLDARRCGIRRGRRRRSRRACRCVPARPAGAAFHRIAELLDKAKPEGVVIAAPNQLHEEIAVACVERGVAVLVEKPVAHTLESAVRIGAAATKHGVATLVGHHRRHNPLLRAARAFIDSGALGTLVTVGGNDLRRKPDAYYEASWRREKGGGPGPDQRHPRHRHAALPCGDIESVVALTSNARAATRSRTPRR
jgi:hypothetical protein